MNSCGKDLGPNTSFHWMLCHRVGSMRWLASKLQKLCQCCCCKSLFFKWVILDLLFSFYFSLFKQISQFFQQILVIMSIQFTDSNQQPSDSESITTTQGQPRKSGADAMYMLCRNHVRTLTGRNLVKDVLNLIIRGVSQFGLNWFLFRETHSTANWKDLLYFFIL